MSQEKEKDPKGKDEAKRDEIQDAELDKVSGGVVNNGLQWVKPKSPSFGGEDWEKK